MFCVCWVYISGGSRIWKRGGGRPRFFCNFNQFRGLFKVFTFCAPPPPPGSATVYEKTIILLFCSLLITTSLSTPGWSSSCYSIWLIYGWEKKYIFLEAILTFRRQSWFFKTLVAYPGSNLADVGPIIKQHWVNVPWLLGNIFRFNQTCLLGHFLQTHFTQIIDVKEILP